jgi:selenocysteine-specific elongation factor
MIVGTAGHIDHGKTALVKALTGVDGDRLKEEKARGITIDLGFAYLPTATGQVLGFIDVPGHERFVHTMLAGASGIDFALLTVAADDGIKPQTVEHLAILDLLGIDRGIVVVTKTDLVDTDRLAAVVAQIAAATAGTALAGADILPVSALTGHGIDELRHHVTDAAAQTRLRSSEGRFRLAVDRSFTLAGVGVVVTGAVLSGSVRVGDHVAISPSGIMARVRSLHAQNRPAEASRAGDRCALNLTGPDISKDAIRRGDVVVDRDLHAPTDRIDAILRALPNAGKPIGQWFPVRLHHAAAEAGARVVLLHNSPIEPGASAHVQLVLDRAIAAAVPDRFVVRDVSAQMTLGGGVLIDLHPPARRRRTPERQAQRTALANSDPLLAIEGLLAAAPFIWDLAAFARDRVLSAAQTNEIIARLGLVVLQSAAANIAMSADQWQNFSSSLMAQVSAYHLENPDLQGIGREKLRLMLQPRLPKPAFTSALQRIGQGGEIVLDGAFIRMRTHVARLEADDKASWEMIAPLLGGSKRFRPPRVRDIAAAAGRQERDVRRLLKLACRMGIVDEIAQDHFFLRETVREMTAIAADVATSALDGKFTAAQFRDRLANGRKVAIHILEFFDRHGVTLNRNDVRRINRHRLDLFGAPVLPSGVAAGGESSLVGRSDFKSEWGSQTVSGGFDSHSLPPATSQSGP